MLVAGLRGWLSAASWLQAVLTYALADSAEEAGFMPAVLSPVHHAGAAIRSACQHIRTPTSPAAPVCAVTRVHAASA